MKTRFYLLVLVAAVGGSVYAGSVLATPASGVTSTVFAVGRFDEIDARATTGHWSAKIRANGPSDLHVLENRIAPGGTFGWHSHPGPSLLIVKSGALSVYRGDDPHCTPQLVEAGSGFVDQGGDVHLVRNEGTVETVVYVTSLVPAGAVRRIDQPSPGNCPF
ncbi:MAG: cupin domain-containing protein [Gaiellaceae bacterium MAG52_C11]|nr:cupin domain-containing protein [Candidatus Gaiellasilicea maunaloa]